MAGVGKSKGERSHGAGRETQRWWEEEIERRIFSRGLGRCEMGEITGYCKEEQTEGGR